MCRISRSKMRGSRKTARSTRIEDAGIAEDRAIDAENAFLRPIVDQAGRVDRHVSWPAFAAAA